MTAKVITVPIETAMIAAITISELDAAKFVATAVLASIAEMVAACTHANAEFLSAGYGRCRNCDSCKGCERDTKFSHVPSSR
jgi:hypothetical protein